MSLPEALQIIGYLYRTHVWSQNLQNHPYPLIGYLWSSLQIDITPEYEP
jgi:hypothetical protein